MDKEKRNAFIAFLLIPAVLYGAWLAYQFTNGNIKHSENYPKTAVVTMLNTDKDEVYLIDPTGNIFIFKGIEDYHVGDAVSLIMSDNGTEKITDDIIVKAQYSGYKGR